MLGITSETFFDLSPKEFYFAAKTVGDSRQIQVQHEYEVARYNAILVRAAKLNSGDLALPWEKGQRIVQTSEELAKSGKALALALGAVEMGRAPGAPPRVLAPKFRK